MQKSKWFYIGQHLLITAVVLSPLLYSLFDIAVNFNRPNAASVQVELKTNHDKLEWQEFSIISLQKALESERIVLVDFYAE